MNNHTDWRQASAAETNQSQGRGWDLRPDQETDKSPLIFWGVVILLALIAGCVMCAQAGMSA